jgi:hypothetical protein
VNKNALAVVEVEVYTPETVCYIVGMGPRLGYRLRLQLAVDKV